MAQGTLDRRLRKASYALPRRSAASVPRSANVARLTSQFGSVDAGRKSCPQRHQFLFRDLIYGIAAQERQKTPYAAWVILQAGSCLRVVVHQPASPRQSASGSPYTDQPFI